MAFRKNKENVGDELDLKLTLFKYLDPLDAAHQLAEQLGLDTGDVLQKMPELKTWYGKVLFELDDLGDRPKIAVVPDQRISSFEEDTDIPWVYDVYLDTGEFFDVVKETRSRFREWLNGVMEKGKISSDGDIFDGWTV